MGELDGNCAPRWEWRTFGAELPEIEAKLGLTARVAPRRSDEIYLLNSAMRLAISASDNCARHGTDMTTHTPNRIIFPNFIASLSSPTLRSDNGDPR